MSSREIAELTGKNHSHVFRDARKMLDELNEEYQEYIQIWTHPQNKQSYEEYALPKDLTITLISGYNLKMRHAITKRWIELESNPQFKIPQTLSQALMLAANQAEKIEKQSEQLKLAAPKVDFVNRFVDSNGNKSFREVAKVLKANEREFRAFLVEFKVMYQLGKKYTAYQSHVEAGRFYVTTGEKNGHAYTDCKFTPKGIEYIAGKWVTHSNK